MSEANTPKVKPKAANGAGTVERRRGQWWARVMLPDGRRKRLPIPNSAKMNETVARAKAAQFAADVREGRIVFEEKSRKGSVTLSATGWHSVRQLGAAWTSGQLFEHFGAVNKLRTKAGAYIDKVTLEAHVYEAKTRGPSGPAFGDLLVSNVTDRDIELVMAAQPKEQRAETRIKQYNRLHRLFDLAIFPLRLRKDNPVLRYVRPQPDAEKLFCFLYPSELLALLRGTNAQGETVVPLGRRVLYALAVYTGQRKGSLFELKWKHADFDHGTLASFKTKTGRAQYFVADRGLMALLEAWHSHQGTPGDDVPIVTDAVVDHERKRLATALRDDLRAVGVSRAILFEDDADNVEALRFHDLRSTFCTWARRSNKSDAWISERTGQEVTGDMINRYDRGAQTLGDLEYAPFPDIADAIPELVAARLATRLAKAAEAHEPAIAESSVIPPAYLVGATGVEPVTPTVSSGTNVAEDLSRVAKQAVSRRGPVPLATPRVEVGQRAGQVDAIETALGTALTEAAAAGRFDVVAQVARELEARRTARAGNVVHLDARRREPKR